MVIDNKGGMSLRVNVSSDADRIRRLPPMRRVSRSPIRGVAGAVGRGRFTQRRTDVLSLNEIRRQRRQQERIVTARHVPPAPASRMTRVSMTSVERERQLLRREREERDFLRQERERLERERRQLERDRLEREK